MAKVMIGVVIGVLLGVFFVLILLAGLNPPIETTQDDFVVVERPVEIEPVYVPELVYVPAPEPSPREEELVDITPDFATLVPQETLFWVNEIMVPPYTRSYYNYIPMKQHDIKTFAGAFGPYAVDPREWLRVELCSEMYDVPMAPACMPVRLSFSDSSVSFAVGLQWDEYIGGLASKDYLAYYVVRSGDAVVAESNKGLIRTMRD